MTLRNPMREPPVLQRDVLEVPGGEVGSVICLLRVVSLLP